MKKLILSILILCLVIVAAVGIGAGKTGALANSVVPETAAESEPEVTVNGDAENSSSVYVKEDGETASEEISISSEESAVSEQQEISDDEPAAMPSTVPDEPTVVPGRLNYDALYSRYFPDEKVLTVNGKEEQWGDYFYILFTQCGQIEDYFDSMAAYYGMQYGWTDPISEDGEESFADAATESAENLMVQLGALEAFAAENGIEVSEEMREMIEAQKQQDVVSALGEEGTPEAFEEYLGTIHLSKEMYDRIVTQNFLYQESFNALYGNNAEKLPDEAAMKYLENNGYISAAHILLLNSNEETGETLDEAALAEKQEQLKSILADLRAIEDDQARKAAFLQKVTELSEDPGYVYYPEGYTYTPGTMVAEFEDAVEALENYEISDVVETSYGYHLIMRLPLSPEAIVEYSSADSTPRTARMLAANQEYAEKLQATADTIELEWLPDHEAPDLISYIAE